MAQMPIQHKEIHSSSGTTMTSLWDYINSLTDLQKDHLVINLKVSSSGSEFTVIVRRALAGTFEGYVSSFGSSVQAISVYLLTGTQVIGRTYPQTGSASQSVLTLVSWSASYID